MENFKENLPMFIIILIAIVVCGLAFYFMESKSSYYYSQIDNTKIEILSTTDNMKYQYTLKCYNEKGKEKEIKFKTSRELKEGAYIKLEVLMISGVHSWEEVQYDELPDKVKTNYEK